MRCVRQFADNLHIHDKTCTHFPHMQTSPTTNMLIVFTYARVERVACVPNTNHTCTTTHTAKSITTVSECVSFGGYLFLFGLVGMSAHTYTMFHICVLMANVLLCVRQTQTHNCLHKSGTNTHFTSTIVAIATCAERKSAHARGNYAASGCACRLIRHRQQKCVRTHRKPIRKIQHMYKSCHSVNHSERQSNSFSSSPSKA